MLQKKNDSKIFLNHPGHYCSPAAYPPSRHAAKEDGVAVLVEEEYGTAIPENGLQVDG